jgi:hypothetical protein
MRHTAFKGMGNVHESAKTNSIDAALILLHLLGSDANCIGECRLKQTELLCTLLRCVRLIGGSPRGGWMIRPIVSGSSGIQGWTNGDCKHGFGDDPTVPRRGTNIVRRGVAPNKQAGWTYGLSRRQACKPLKYRLKQPKPINQGAAKTGA